MHKSGSGSALVATGASSTVWPENPPRTSAPSGQPIVLTEDQFSQFLERITVVATEAVEKAAMKTVQTYLEKKNNVALVGVPESQMDNLALNSHDRSMESGLFSSLGIDQASLQSVFLDGRKGPFPRIIKVCFKDKHVVQRNEFLSRATRILQHNFSKTARKPFARHDLTYDERAADKKLREDLKAIRKDTDEHWTIRKGKIVRKPGHADFPATCSATNHEYSETPSLAANLGIAFTPDMVDFLIGIYR